MSIISAAAAATLLPELQRLRRDLHREPELGLDLPKTQARVAAGLDGLDVEVTYGQSLSSLTVVLRGGKRDPEKPVAVLLRGDMDALPVTEATGFDFASTNGAMHACGHDLHTTGLYGALRLLHDVRDELAGDVIFMFQPGEEGYDGAGHMLREGVLEAAGVPVIAAFGVHVSADQPLGNLYCRPGSYMSAFSIMNITVRGKGGHASRPHTGRDPIQAGAMLVGQLQEYATRRFDAFDPVIITVGQFHAGTAPNVIPDTAELTVGIRCFSQATTARTEAELPNLVSTLVSAHGLEADVDYRSVLPPVINDETETAFYLDTAAEVFGPSRTHLVTVPKPGSEDFSRILQQVPGTYGHLGAALPGTVAEEQDSNHSPRARHTDEGLADHARFLAELAAGRLHQHAAAAPAWRGTGAAVDAGAAAGDGAGARSTDPEAGETETEGNLT